MCKLRRRAHICLETRLSWYHGNGFSVVVVVVVVVAVVVGIGIGIGTDGGVSS